jgi:hypothetical protein
MKLSVNSSSILLLILVSRFFQREHKAKFIFKRNCFTKICLVILNERPLIDDIIISVPVNNIRAVYITEVSIFRHAISRVNEHKIVKGSITLYFDRLLKFIYVSFYKLLDIISNRHAKEFECLFLDVFFLLTLLLSYLQLSLL